MKKILAFLIIISSFESCSLKKWQDAAGKTTAFFDATSYQIGIEKSIDSQHGSKNMLALTLYNPKVNNYSSNDEATSIAASVFFANLKPVQYKDVDIVKIGMKVNDGEFYKEYKISDLKDLEGCRKVINLYFNMIQKRDTGLVSLFDTLYSGNVIPQVLKFEVKLDSTYGPIDNIIFGGFTFDKLKDSDKPVIAIVTQNLNGGHKIKHKFYLLRENNKIVYVRIKD